MKLITSHTRGSRVVTQFSNSVGKCSRVSKHFCAFISVTSFNSFKHNLPSVKKKTKLFCKIIQNIILSPEMEAGNDK